MKNSRQVFPLYSLLILFLFILRTGYAGSKTLEIIFKVRDENVYPISVVNVEVFTKEDNKLIATKTTGTNGNIGFVLDLNNEYIIVFNKNGFATKKMWIDAHIKGQEEKVMLYYNLEKLIYMYPPASKLLTGELLDKPFSKLIYDVPTNDFNDDDAYEKAIQSEAIRFRQNNINTNSQLPNVISGKLYAGDPVSTPLNNVDVDLVDDNGNVVQTTSTNQYGRFTFTKAVPGKNYITQARPKQKIKKISLLSISLEKIADITPDNKGNFTYRLLGSDKNTLSLLKVEDDNLAISGNLLQVLKEGNKPLANKKVLLVNDKNEIIESATTNEFGTFAFTKLPPDQNFSIRFDESDPSLAAIKMLMTNKNGNEIGSSSAKDKFEFQFLSSNKQALDLLAIDDTQLKIDISGFLLKGTNKIPYGNKKINITAETGNVLQSMMTDPKGKFRFTQLNAEQKYLITLEETDLSIFYIANDKGVIVKECTLEKNADKGFRFRLLPSDQKQLGSVYVDDPWLNILHLKSKQESHSTESQFTITEPIYFNFNEDAILPEAEKVLDKVVYVMGSGPKIKIEIAAHTDTKGTEEYNMELSKRRAQNVLTYLTRKGIEPGRIQSKGYGEIQPVVKCLADTDCTEEEQALNRRIEFKVLIGK